jgi:hypothetical protein
MPSLPWRYLICAQSCTVITYPILAGWPIFKEHNWPSFQSADIRLAPRLAPLIRVVLTKVRITGNNIDGVWTSFALTSEQWRVPGDAAHARSPS